MEILDEVLMTSENTKLTEQLVQYNIKFLSENLNEFKSMLIHNIKELKNSFDYIQNEIEKITNKLLKVKRRKLKN